MIETHEVWVIKRNWNVDSFCGLCAIGAGNSSQAQVRMISPEQAATVAGVNIRTIYRWIEGGRVHFVETSDRKIRVCLASVNDCIS